MNEERERALTLAQQAETSMGFPETSAVVKRAQAYFDFLIGAFGNEADNPKVAPESAARGF